MFDYFSSEEYDSHSINIVDEIINFDWNASPYELYCDRWSLENVLQTFTLLKTVEIDGIQGNFNYSCSYGACSNIVAYDLQELDN